MQATRWRTLGMRGLLVAILVLQAGLPSVSLAGQIGPDGEIIPDSCGMGVTDTRERFARFVIVAAIPAVLGVASGVAAFACWRGYRKTRVRWRGVATGILFAVAIACVGGCLLSAVLQL